MAANDARLDVTAMLAPERASLMALLRGMSPDDWDRPTECPAWTVQRHRAPHPRRRPLAARRQRDAATDGITLFAEDHAGMAFHALLDGFNEQWVTAATFLGTDRS